MTNSAKRLEERVADLEIRLNQSEDTVDELNRTIYRQQVQIDQLIQAMGSLRDRMEDAGPREFKSLLDDVPPHY
jgi:SlyX protein